MMHLLINWLVTAFAVLLASWILPGVRVQGFGTALLVAAVFGILNALGGWLLFAFFGIATLGLGFLLGFLTRWLVNTLLLRLTDALIKGFQIDTWLKTALASLLISVVSSAAQVLIGGR